MSEKCYISDEKSRIALSIRTQSAVQNLGAVIGPTFGKIAGYLSELGISLTGDPFIGHFNTDMENLDLEIGILLEEKVPDKGDVKMSEIPAGKYAVTIHRGSYNELKNANMMLNKWIEDNNYVSTNIGFEFYLNEPGTVPEEELETKIIVLLKV